MKKLLQLLCLLLSINSFAYAQNILVGWNMRNPTAVSGRDPELNAQSSTGQTFEVLPKLTMGPNLFADATITGNTGGFGGDIKSAGTIPTTLAEAISTGTYYQIILQPKVGETVSLGSVDFRIRREFDKSPNVYAWTYSINNTNNASFLANKLTEKTIPSTDFYQLSSNTATTGNGGNNGVIQPTVDLSNVAALTDLTSTSTIYLRIYFWNTVDLGSTPIATAKGYSLGIAKSISSTATDYSVLNIKGITTLPVTLSSFKATRQSNSVQLNWATASEKDNNYFNVLRAGDDKQFVTIGKINGSGTLATSKAYNLTDFKPNAGANYYKLTQTDFNGDSKEIGEVQHVTFDLSSTALAILQNTDQNTVKALLNANKTESALISIYNIAGSSLHQASLAINKGVNEIKVPINLNKGVYILQVKTQSGEALQAKFVR